MEKKERVLLAREGLNLLALLASALLVAAGLHVFVYRANFAPSGIDGLATMLQYLSEEKLGYKINAGIFTLALNLPLLFGAWFILRRRYVLYTLFYIGALSLFLMAFDGLGLYQYDCLGDPACDPLIAAIFGGVAQGITGIPLRLGGSSGGVDVVGGMLAVRFPHKNVERLIAYVSYLVVALAFLVYRDLGSVCLSVISIFVCERVSTVFLRPARGALRFEIVCGRESAARIREFILYDLCHGATILHGEGGFSGEGREVIVCLVSYRRLPELLEYLKGEKEAFLSYSEVLGVHGNFGRRPGDEREEDVRLRNDRRRDLGR